MSEVVRSSATRPSRVSCPNCGQPFSELDLADGAGVVAACERCGSLWVDDPGYATLMASRVPLAGRMFLDKATRSRQPSKGGAYRTAGAQGGCPICRGAMKGLRVNDSTIRGVGCDGHGSLFDPGQAIRLMALASADEAAREITLVEAYEAPVAHAHGVRMTAYALSVAAVAVFVLLRACQ